MKYLIQGCFFQHRQCFNIAYRAESEGGTGVVVQEGLGQFMYSGVIFPHPNDPDMLIGEMLDHFGESQLFDVEIQNESVKFSKKYIDRTDIIHYEFNLKEGVWVGKYEVKAKGAGDAKCIITIVEDSFFLPPE